MPLEMSEWEDPQLYQVYRKLFRRASTEEELLVARQALPPLWTRDREWLWEYTYPIPIYTLSYCRAIKWLNFVVKRREEEKSLQAPPSVPGPPPSVHNILGAALHESEMKKRKRMKESPPAVGGKRKRD
jgi:hypothetical protein